MASLSYIDAQMHRQHVHEKDLRDDRWHMYLTQWLLSIVHAHSLTASLCSGADAVPTLTLQRQSSLLRAHPEGEQWAQLDHAHHLRHTTPASQLTVRCHAHRPGTQLTCRHTCLTIVWTASMPCFARSTKQAVGLQEIHTKQYRTATRKNACALAQPEQASAILKQISSWVFTMLSYHPQPFCNASGGRQNCSRCKDYMQERLVATHHAI